MMMIRAKSNANIVKTENFNVDIAVVLTGTLMLHKHESMQKIYCAILVWEKKKQLMCVVFCEI